MGVGETIGAAVGEADIPFVAGPAVFPPVARTAPRAAGLGDFAAGALGLDVGGAKQIGLDDRGNRGTETAEGRAGGDF